MPSPPRNSFERAREAFQEMESASDLETLQDAWEDFLIYHQRTWNRCLACYKGKPFWGPLEPKFAAQRANDPLLQYIRQARHTEEHGIELSSQVQSGFTTLSPGTYTGGTTISGGGSYVLGAGSTGRVSVHPTSVRTQPVVNRGVEYLPPVLSGDSNPPVVKVAQEALKFYEALFAQINAAGED
jgi:hypothetical protein